jgi:hypothetical protein
MLSYRSCQQGIAPVVARSDGGSTNTISSSSATVALTQTARCSFAQTATKTCTGVRAAASRQCTGDSHQPLVQSAPRHCESTGKSTRSNVRPTGRPSSSQLWLTPNAKRNASSAQPRRVWPLAQRKKLSAAVRVAKPGALAQPNAIGSATRASESFTRLASVTTASLWKLVARRAQWCTPSSFRQRGSSRNHIIRLKRASHGSL